MVEEKGKILINQLENKRNNKAIEVWCCDIGKGISNLDQSITDGFTDKKSLGIGLGTIRRFSDEFEINPQISQITNDIGIKDFEDFSSCIRTLKWIPVKPWMGKNSKLIIGAASRCKPGENLNGDSYIINHINSTKTVAAVIDGLGHGKNAHIASQKAKEQILLHPELPVDKLMMNIHNGIRGTRGTVIGLLNADTEINKLYFSGIGNIEGFLCNSEVKKIFYHLAVL